MGLMLMTLAPKQHSLKHYFPNLSDLKNYLEGLIKYRLPEYLPKEPDSVGRVPSRNLNF